MSRSIRRSMIDRDHQQLSLVRQPAGRQPGLPCTTRPVPTRAEDLELMPLMDRQYLKTVSRSSGPWPLPDGAGAGVGVSGSIPFEQRQTVCREIPRRSHMSRTETPCLRSARICSGRSIFFSIIVTVTGFSE